MNAMLLLAIEFSLLVWLVCANSTLPEFFDGLLPSRWIYTTSVDSIRAAQLITAAAAIDSLIVQINSSGIETRPYKHSQAHFSASHTRFSLMYSQELARPGDTEKLLSALKHSTYRLSTYVAGDEFVNIRAPGLNESASLFIYNIDAAIAEAFEQARRPPLHTASEVQQ